MNPKARPLFILTLLAATVGLLGYRGYRQAERSARAGWNLVPVITAATDVDAGTVLLSEMVVQRSMPSQFASTNVARPEDFTKVVGKKTLIPLKKGDALLWSELGK